MIISKTVGLILCSCISLNLVSVNKTNWKKSYNDNTDSFFKTVSLKKKTSKDKKQKSTTNQYFEIATNLTSNEVTYKNKAYYFGVYRIPSEYNDNLSKYGKFESEVLYYCMANYLDGFSINLNSGSSYSSEMVGVKTTSREEFQPYYDNLSQFILNKTSNQDKLIVLMNKFQANSQVSGNFDYDSRNFSFTINDCNACANEMGVSEESLGFILAFLTIYGSEITFNGKQCNFEYTNYQTNS